MTVDIAGARVATDAAPGPGMVRQAVVSHIYCWLTLRPAALGAPGQVDHHRAYRGDVVNVSEDEAARGQALGALVDPEDYDAGVDAVDALAGVASDEELAAMDAEELIGYVTQHATEAQRVYDLEKERKRPRVTVIRAAGFDPETGEPIVEGTGDAGDVVGDRLIPHDGAGPSAVAP